MKINTVIPIIFLCFLSVGAAIHEHYVGITEIRYSDDSESYQISLKLFTDDLENAILKDSGDFLDLGGSNENANSDSIIFPYLEKHFFIESPVGSKFKLTRIGRETDFNITWVYLESAKMKPQDALKVKNSIFMEMHPDQTHVVNVDQKGETKSTLLHSSKTEELMKL